MYWTCTNLNALFFSACVRVDALSPTGSTKPTLADSRSRVTPVWKLTTRNSRLSVSSWSFPFFLSSARSISTAALLDPPTAHEDNKLILIFRSHLVLSIPQTASQKRTRNSQRSPKRATKLPLLCPPKRETNEQINQKKKKKARRRFGLMIPLLL